MNVANREQENPKGTSGYASQQISPARRNWVIAHLICLAWFLSLAACNEVETPNGEIPSQYRSRADSLLGVFRGEFNHVQTTLIVNMNGQKPSIEVAQPKNDLFGGGCGSRIKDLQRVRISGQRLTTAIFGFSSGNCVYIPATEASLRFDNNDSFQLEVLESASWVENCHPHLKVKSEVAFAERLPPAAPLNPNPLCRWEEKRQYARGRFTRVQ